MTTAAPPPALSPQKQFFEMLMASQYWTPQQMQNYQRARLAPLLRHARANVPFYAHRLDAVFRSDGDIDWNRWSEIPIVTRADLIERRDEMQATVAVPGQGKTATFHTSGSTGVPVITTHNAAASMAAGATNFRGHLWHGLDWSRPVGEWVVFDDPGYATYPEGAPPSPWGPPWSEKSRGLQYVVNRSAPPADALEYFGQHRPAYLRLGASDSRILAFEAQRLGHSLQVEAILMRGSALTPEAEDLHRTVFGARVIPHYSSKEGYRIAHFCPDRRNYHVNAENVVVEIIDTDGNECRPGEMGRVVITPLFSTAQPLIRYEQGDFAKWAEGCTCGRALPAIAEISGRMKHAFRMPDGQFVFPRIAAAALQGINSTATQIAQTGLLDIEVRYVPRGRAVPEAEAALAEAIKAATDARFSVVFRRIDSFNLKPNQKHQDWVSEIDGPR